MFKNYNDASSIGVSSEIGKENNVTNVTINGNTFGSEEWKGIPQERKRGHGDRERCPLK